MSKPFNAPPFVNEEAQVRFFFRYGEWKPTPDLCLVCITCGDWIYPGDPIANGPVHRTFDCCSCGEGGWSWHDPVTA